MTFEEQEQYAEKSDCVQSARMNVLRQSERVSFTKKTNFDDRDITKDPSAISELQKLGFLTTPVTVIGDEVIVGFDVPKLDAALKG